MDDLTKILAQNKTATWQQRVSDDSDWLHNKIESKLGFVQSLDQEEKTHRREIISAIEYGTFGVIAGAGFAALESVMNKEPVKFSRFSTYAGGTGIALALLGVLISKDPELTKTSRSEAHDLQHLNSIRNLLADAYGEDVIKGQEQRYLSYQNVKNNPMLTTGYGVGSGLSR